MSGAAEILTAVLSTEYEGPHPLCLSDVVRGYPAMDVESRDLSLHVAFRLHVVLRAAA